jgi:hypothetical protein
MKMKKYKLIKEYPGSLKLGSIATTKGGDDLWKGSTYYDKYPEFWEELIEKDYKILSYVAKDNPNNITTKRRGAHLHEEYWKINSVKRLSDGEVFTVGDRAKVYEYGSIKTITEIVVNDTKSILTEGIWLRYDSGSSHMTHAIKVKNPIFLTHNGKDIFTEDTVWYVNKENFYYDHIIAFPEVKFNSEIRAYFLTEEEAKEYIERNKPRLSIEDCFKILQKSFLYGNSFEKEIEKYIRKNNK